MHEGDITTNERNSGNFVDDVYGKRDQVSQIYDMLSNLKAKLAPYMVNDGTSIGSSGEEMDQAPTDMDQALNELDSEITNVKMYVQDLIDRFAG